MKILLSRFKGYFDIREHKAVIGDILTVLSFGLIATTTALNIAPDQGFMLVPAMVAVFFVVVWLPIRLLYFIFYLLVGPDRLEMFSTHLLVGKEKTEGAVPEKEAASKLASSEYIPAGFGVRFVARVIDSVLVGAIYVVILFVILIFVKIPKLSYSSVMAIKEILFIFYSILFLALDSTMPGKAFLGMKVTDYEGEPLTFNTAVIRSFASLLSGLILGLGYLMILSDEEKHRALHDRIARTLVVRSSDAPKKRVVVLGIVAIILTFISFIQLISAYHIKFPKIF